MKIVFLYQSILLKWSAILTGMMLLLQPQYLQAQVISINNGAYFSVISGTVGVAGNISVSNATATLNNSGTITAVTLINDGTVQGNGTYDLSGDFTNNLTFTAGSSTVNLNGTTAQAIGGSAASTFNNLTNSNTSAAVTAGNNITVSSALTLNTSSILGIASNTLTLNGTVTGAGKLKGTASSGVSTSNLVIGGTVGTLIFDQTTAATRSLNDLTLNSGASATLGNALDVYGTIALTTATLNLNALNLTLKSDSSGTARIANLTGSTLSGATNVTAERYIKLRTPGTGDGTGNYGRAYRLLAPTVNTGGSIRTNWMEGGMNTVVGTNVNPVPNFGTHITGSGGNTNGFDVTQTNQSSLYNTTNAVTPTYSAVGSTSGTLNALTGYFLYIRGDRSMSTTVTLAINMPTSHTTLRATGTLVTGTQTSFTNTLIGGGALNLVTNPYASPIDWSLVYGACTNVTTSYTLWDPNNGTRGGFVTVTTGGIASSGVATRFIQGGQAFFVQASGGVPTVSIQEGHKAPGNNNGVFRPATTVESFRTELYFTEPSSYRRIADGVIALYDNSYSAGIDGNDAKEINNWDENIAIAREGKNLAIEGRPVILTRDTLPLFMNNMKQKPYEFEFTPSLFTNSGLKAELIDNFLATRTVLSVTAATVVPFTVTSNPASSATGRFMVVFGPLSPLAVDVITVKATKKSLGVQVDWTSKTETDMDRYEVERSATGSNFSRKTTVAAIGNSSSPVNYSWFDANPEMGNNFYRIKGFDRAGNLKYSPVAKVFFGKDAPGIVIYPNPIKGNSFSIDLNNMAKGMYSISLINNLGQEVYSSQVQHDGGTATKTITMKQALPNGIYQLVLRGENGMKMTQKIIKN